MTDDIVERLRDTADIGVPDFTNSPIMREAADEIEKLRKQKHDISVALKNIRAENEKLRAALKPFATVASHGDYGGPLVQARIYYECETEERAGKMYIDSAAFRAAAAALKETRE